VNAGFVGESVFTDNGFVWLNDKASQLRYQLAGTVNLGRLDSSRDIRKEVRPGMDCHDDFFHGRIARPLADTVNRAFNLTCTIANTGQRIG